MENGDKVSKSKAALISAASYSTGFVSGLIFAPYVGMVSDRIGLHPIIAGFVFACIFGMVIYKMD